MSNQKRARRIRKSDYARVIVTDTIPYETPIIFSNEGFHNNATKLHPPHGISSTLRRILIRGEVQSKNTHSTIPLNYKIRKTSVEYRQLGLIHPWSQWKIKEFYEKYEGLIAHYCRESPASIRAPIRVASTFYTKNSWDDINKYKSGEVSSEDTDKLTRYSPSFFAYRGYSRLYKFFQSRDYYDLEKRFSTMATLDVAKCFDSIYTHCLSWAVKSKEFTKQHKSIDSTFPQEFDALMQHGNHGETNGIIIGPEASRVFAEILFQSVDRRAITHIREKSGKRFGIDYEIRRYVDDVYIFCNTDSDADVVHECYADCLRAVNLHVNNSKCTRTLRPFITKKSKIIDEVNLISDNFFDSFLSRDNDERKLSTKKIWNEWSLTRRFFESIKSICMRNAVQYDEVSSYLISMCSERVKKLASIDLSEASPELRRQHRDALTVLLEVIYFLYGVAPSVGASYKVCVATILSIRFSKEQMPEHLNFVSQKIYDLSSELMFSERLKFKANVENFISLEAINIALAMKELGDAYLLPTETVEKLFMPGDKISYFGSICCLYYIGGHPKYSALFSKVLSTASSTLGDLKNILMSSEQCHLLLDLVSCPLIDEKVRKAWLCRLYKQFNLSPPNAAQFKEFFDTNSKNYWFVQWDQLDLLNALEKKELKQAY